MSFKADMTSPDLDRQLELLKYYPEVMEKHFRSALEKDASLLADEIRPNIPQGPSGRSRRQFRSKVMGKGVFIEARVGWWGKNQPWWINVVEHGAKEHPIEAREGGFLFFGGRVVRSVQHPGMSAQGFMAAGFSAVRATIDRDMLVASQNVLEEMVVK